MTGDVWPNIHSFTFGKQLDIPFVLKRKKGKIIKRSKILGIGHSYGFGAEIASDQETKYLTLIFLT